MFAALKLSEAGLMPVVYERGDSVEERHRKVDEFWNTGKLDTQSNVQFGEGGAGTFSDGKLNTVIKDPTGRIRNVLEMFVRFGASSEILYSNKPHIGTETEMKEAKLRMEDALNATRAAVEEGIIAGGGSAYIHASKEVAKLAETLEGDEKTGANWWYW